VLILADANRRSERIVQWLRKGGFSPLAARVEDERQFLEQLLAPPNVVLMDHALTGFDAPRVLELLRERELDIPLLVVAAAKDNGDASKILRAGAEDFIVGKGIAGLGESVRNALRRRELRRHGDRRTELALRASEERFRATFNQAAVGLAHVSVEGRYMLVNKRLCDILGYSAEELLQKTLWEISHPEDREATAIQRKRLFAGEIDTFSVEKRYLRKDGRTVWANLVVSQVRNASGKPEYDLAAYEDITQRKLVEEALKESESRHRAVIENAAEGIIIHDASGRIVSTNSSAERILGRRKDQLIGKSPATLEFDAVREDGTPWSVEMRPVAMTLRTGEPQSDVVMGHRGPDGSLTWLSMNVRALGGSDGQPPSGVVISFTDITERRSFEERLTFLAQNDALTGLPNRALLLDRLGQAITRAARRGTLLGVMLVDLDRFKEINDSLGHSAGDAVLKEVAGRVRRALRDSDTVARIGGDEFCVVLEDCESREKLAVAAAKLRHVLEDPIAAESREMFTGASIGLAVYPEDGDSIEDLIKHADIAMYDAKREGGNAYRFYSRELHSKPADQIGLGTALRHAVERNELVVHYQPQIDIESGRPVGVEALLHWRHPEFGILPPKQFIHIAEDTGLIVPIGEWVLKTACAEAKAWQQAGLPQLSVAVNLSARQFRDAQLAGKVAATLAATGLAPRFLELEITESVIMSETGHTINALTRLAHLGVRVSIDDFGTGYSSLAYLKRFPVHKLKIDRTFIRDIHSDRDDAAIVQAIITLAKTLNLGVVAEGVETSEQLAFLANLGCDQYQGYYFSSGLPPKELIELLRSKFWYFS
jgi:diguanylate cyclase (GGDEF)-like protein/PAS domain S-box-containing protein